ncbi:MAG: hypothetical protein U0166_13680 [Acidobacteriota bacterium]
MLQRAEPSLAAEAFEELLLLVRVLGEVGPAVFSTTSCSIT